MTTTPIAGPQIDDPRVRDITIAALQALADCAYTPSPSRARAALLAQVLRQGVDYRGGTKL
jgi:hypothetical protein